MIMMKNTKIKFSSDDELPLYKTIEVPTMTIAARTIFLEDSKYYPQVFLDGFLDKI